MRSLHYMSLIALNGIQQSRMLQCKVPTKSDLELTLPTKSDLELMAFLDLIP